MRPANVRWARFAHRGWRVTEFAIAGLVLAAACTLTTGCSSAHVKKMPDGRPGLAIDCSGASLSWAACYERAGMACPRGYRIEKQVKKAGNDFVSGDLLTLFGNKSLHRSLLIRCKNL